MCIVSEVTSTAAVSARHLAKRLVVVPEERPATMLTATEAAMLMGCGRSARRRSSSWHRNDRDDEEGFEAFAGVVRTRM